MVKQKKGGDVDGCVEKRKVLRCATFFVNSNLDSKEMLTFIYFSAYEEAAEGKYLWELGWNRDRLFVIGRILSVVYAQLFHFL